MNQNHFQINCEVTKDVKINFKMHEEYFLLLYIYIIFSKIGFINFYLIQQRLFLTL